MLKGIGSLLAVVAVCACGVTASAEVNIETVTVGNPGNAGDTHGDGYGGVAYEYNIGKYEVTAGQYTAFLNAVAATDTYGLYNTDMWSSSYGCKIERSGSSGSYTYSVAGDWADRPVNYVSWGDAARFCNWLHNGQPAGPQDLGTTEDGSYFLDGAMSHAELQAVTREPDATWAIPSEDEWYKAAYHKNDGVTGNYFDYPTSTSAYPSNDLVNPDPGNNATFYDNGYTIGSPYYRTEVGAHENSDSPYGTFDQGGNVWEWNEAVLSGSYRGVRGGSFHDSVVNLPAWLRYYFYPTGEVDDFGFRVSDVAVDTDGDGVDDAIDVCNNTPPGIPVDAEGRPLGDIDLDCDTDMDDFALFQQSMTGPLDPIGACCYYPGGVCVLETEAECTGVWQGAGTSCDPNPCTALPDMVLVPAGEFEMGDSFGEGGSHELPVHDVYLDAYYIDTYEVTNQQYAGALNWAWAQGGLIHVIGGIVYQDGGTTYPYCDTYSADDDSRIHWDGNTFTVTAGKEDHPMVEVSWYGAVAFSNWRSAMEGRTPCYDLATWTCDFDADGFRLPTEAEWEKAAGWDPDLEYHFRFGEHSDGCGYNCLDGQRANYESSGDPFETGDYPRTTPVGYYDGSDHGGTYQTQDAQSYYGCRDMSGNVWEWCHDWYHWGYYSSSPYDNPTGPGSGTDRVLRGGCWVDIAHYCRVADRYHYTPDARSLAYGFRCAVGTP